MALPHHISRWRYYIDAVRAHFGVTPIFSKRPSMDLILIDKTVITPKKSMVVMNIVNPNASQNEVVLKRAVAAAARIQISSITQRSCKTIDRSEKVKQMIMSV